MHGHSESPIIEGDMVYKFHTVTEEINLSYIVEGELPDEENEIQIG